MKKYISLALGLCALMSCKKDAIPEYSESISVGQTSEMTILTQNESYSYCQYCTNYEIDLDQDSTADFSIYANSNPSGASYYCTVFFKPLHNDAYIAGTETTFSVYSSTDTVYNSSNSPVTESITNLHSCVSNGETPSTTVTTLYPTQFAANESLSTSTNWTTNETTLLGYQSEVLNVGPAVNDTVTGVLNKHDYGCNDPAYSTDFYVGLKVVKDGAERLGWVKLSIDPSTTSGTVSIKEIAAQSQLN